MAKLTAKEKAKINNDIKHLTQDVIFTQEMLHILHATQYFKREIKGYTVLENRLNATIEELEEKINKLEAQLEEYRERFFIAHRVNGLVGYNKDLGYTTKSEAQEVLIDHLKKINVKNIDAELPNYEFVPKQILWSN